MAVRCRALVIQVEPVDLGISAGSRRFARPIASQVVPPMWARCRAAPRRVPSRMTDAVGGVTMRINQQVVVFDAADLSAESSFWAGVLDGTVETDDDWHAVLVDGEPRVAVQLAPNHVPPDWPDGAPEQQIHLDLWVEDFETAHERVTSLGARVLKPAEDVDSPDNFQVYADPAGHPFCLCAC